MQCNIPVYCWSTCPALQGQVSDPIRSGPFAVSIALSFFPQVGVAVDVAMVTGRVGGHGVEEVGEMGGSVGGTGLKPLIQQQLGGEGIAQNAGTHYARMPI